MADKWADWLHHRCSLGGPQRMKEGDKVRSSPQVEGLATSPLPFGVSPRLQSGGLSQKWPTCGRVGYVSGSPTLKVEDKIRSGPQMGGWATSPLPSRGSPMLQSGGQNQKWSTSGRVGAKKAK